MNFKDYFQKDTLNEANYNTVDNVIAELKKQGLDLKYSTYSEGKIEKALNKILNVFKTRIVNINVRKRTIDVEINEVSLDGKVLFKTFSNDYLKEVQKIDTIDSFFDNSRGNIKVFSKAQTFDIPNLISSLR